MSKLHNAIIGNKKRIIFWSLLSVTMLIFAQQKYYALIIALFGIYAIVATALDVLFGYTGQISLGHAGLFAIGAYSTTLFTMRANIPGGLSLLLGALFTTVIGALIAIPASKLIKHFLSLLMIAFGQIIYLIVNSWNEVTGGSLGILNIPELSIFGFVFDSYLKSAILIWIVVGVTLVIKSNIIHSRVGYSFVAIRENTVAAKGLGINVRRYKVLAFAISAFFTGLAGGFYAFLRGFISPETFNATQSVLFMTMLLFGGMTSIEGPVIGAIILLLFKEVLQVFSNWQGLIYALFMLLVLYFFPDGVIGITKRLSGFIRATFGKEKKMHKTGDIDA